MDAVLLHMQEAELGEYIKQHLSCMGGRHI